MDKTRGCYICIYLSLVAPETNASVAQAGLESKGSGSAVSSISMFSSRLCWAIYAGSCEGNVGKALRNLMVFTVSEHVVGGYSNFPFYWIQMSFSPIFVLLRSFSLQLMQLLMNVLKN